MIQLTDDLIRNAFVKTGMEETFFSVYEEFVKHDFNEGQQKYPDDEDTPESESNAICSINRASEYITFYVEEIQKGHSDGWATAYALEYLELEFNRFREFFSVRAAYESISDEEQREQELQIFVNSLSDDSIFRERYKLLFYDGNPYAYIAAREYSEDYHQCVQDGKSDTYAHGFANAMSLEYNEYYGDIYAEAYEQAKYHGMSHDQAHLFGDCCSSVCDQNTWFDPKTYLQEYHEDWQKEFFLYIANKDYKQHFNISMPDLDDLRDEIYKYSC